MVSDELGVIVTAIVALGAGFIRGFTGFGGPAFMLAILTLFYTPLAIVSKILVVELISSSYLFISARRQVNWRNTIAVTIPTMLTMPLEQWLLLETDPHVMRRAIAVIILMTSVVMLLGYRYKKPLSGLAMAMVGLLAGVVFGATYIALILVAAILLGPYDKSESRRLFIAWAFLVASWYAVISVINGAVGVRDVIIALPGAAMYFVGTWLGSRWFHSAAEHRYRQVALVTLLVLSALSFLN